MHPFQGPAGPVPTIPSLTRRRFVEGLAGTALAGAVFGTGPSHAATPSPVLTGPDIDLDIGALPVNFTGRARLATAINGSVPGPLLRLREGEEVRIRVANRLAVPSSVHWHGLLVPAAMDGAPGFSFTGIEPGEAFEYRFRLRQNGTYWYHSHSGLQEQTGHYGPLVILPREPAAIDAERDHVVMLSDWTDEDPVAVLRHLKKQADYYNRHPRTVGDFLADARRLGWRQAARESLDWGTMRMSRTDLADVSGVTYTYLMNGTTPAGNWTALYRRGERVRLRFINAGAMSIFDVRIPGLDLTVVAADGQEVHPVTVEEFRLAPGETCDVIVKPADESAYTIFAQSADRSGYARGTLAPRPGMSASVPAPDRRVMLTMADMGHGPVAGAVDHSAHAGHAGHDMGAAAYAVLPAGLHHAPAEFGPGVDMRTAMPSARLDDPGVGLRDNGRRVLTYADLHSIFPDPDGRDPGRTIELHLTGHMERYLWSFNGVGFMEAEPLRLNYGERVRIVLVNDSMMEHPIHLHGLWSDLEDEQGEFRVRKHTINVRPGHLNSFRVTADALGRWPFHCHLMLHMENSMFLPVIVDTENGHAS
ncbi:MAG: copper resistance system multicopper oxidase [Gammaproteobacteria bacterium]|nr:copper resistance system multicopper oxidase [Gammaproteobacteria bacterium]